MNGLYSYMDTDIMYIETVESVVCNRCNKLNTAFEKAMLIHQQNLRDIESKIILESGTESDLAALYLAEAEEVKKETTGILSKLANAIKAFFRKIKEFLFGTEKEIKDIPDEKLPDEVKLDNNPDDLVKDAKQTTDKLDQILGGKKGLIFKAVGVGIGVGVAHVVNKKLIKPTIKNLKDTAAEIEKKNDNYEERIENANLGDEEKESAKGFLNHLRAIGSNIMKDAKTLSSVIRNKDGARDQYKETSKVNKEMNKAESQRAKDAKQILNDSKSTNEEKAKAKQILEEEAKKAVKNKEDDKTDSSISKSAAKQQADLSSNIGDGAKKQYEYEQNIKKLKKEKDALRTNADLKASEGRRYVKEYERFATLSAKKNTSELSSGENAEYNELSSKYSAVLGKRLSRAKNIDNDINETQNKLDELNKNLDDSTARYNNAVSSKSKAEGRIAGRHA